MTESPQTFGDEVNDRSFNEIMVFGGSMGDSNHNSRTNTSKFNAPEVNFNGMEFEQDEPFHSLVSPEKLQEQMDMIKWETTIKELKDGYYFTKYAKDGAKPHNKKVFINPDE
jgi:hypothetical protein